MAARQLSYKDGSAADPGLPYDPTGPRAQLVKVTAFGDEAAVTLLDEALRAACPSDNRISEDERTAKRLAGICGGLQLTLQIMAALLTADPTLGAGELADELGAELERPRNLRYDCVIASSARSLAAALELSYRRLPETPARVFRLLSVSPGPDVSTFAVSALADLPVSQVRRALATLARACLVEASPGGEGRWRVHAIVRLYAHELSEAYAENDEREQARDLLLGYYLNMAEAADAYLRVQPGMAVPQEFASQDSAVAWLDAEWASLIASAMMAADTGRDQVALTLPLLLAHYLSWRRRFDELIAITTVSVNAARRLGDRYREGDALNNLGAALQEVRRFEEAINADQEAAIIYRETGDRHSEGGTLNNLGLAWKGLRRFEEAINAHQEAAAIFRETSDRHGEGDALNNLGLAFRESGRSEEAISALRDAVAIFRETSDRHGEGDALNNLGLAFRESGRSEEAISALRDAVAIFRETSDRYREDVALKNLERAQAALPS